MLTALAAMRPVGRPVEAAGIPVTQPTVLTALAEALTPLGLRLRGGFALVPETDEALLRLRPDARTMLLVGNVGSEMWRRSGAAIKGTGAPHPLDRWTRTVIAPIEIGRAHV